MSSRPHLGTTQVDGDAQQIEVDGVGGLGRDQARVDQRTLAHDQTLVVELPVTFLEQRPRQIMPRQLLGEPADRRVIPPRRATDRPPNSTVPAIDAP